jgi:3-deoxy-manno-octulosonate cytidylyltransferase (CMP-KDO synthetase)
MTKKVLILIPARYESSRFPGKPLYPIKGKPMIHYVVENCIDSGFDYAVVTDSLEIEKSVKSIGGVVVRVDDDVVSGSVRIALAYERFYQDKVYDLVINVQGDEPLLKSSTIKELAKYHLESDFDIATIVRQRKTSEDDFQNPNVVKCIKSNIEGRCLYFTRASAPFHRDDSDDWFQHIGVYSYRPTSLQKFNSYEVSYLENKEKLEQLRALENGMSIGAMKITHTLLGVDTPEDVKRVEGVLE